MNDESNIFELGGYAFEVSARQSSGRLVVQTVGTPIDAPVASAPTTLQELAVWASSNPEVDVEVPELDDDYIQSDGSVDGETGAVEWHDYFRCARRLGYITVHFELVGHLPPRVMSVVVEHSTGS